MFLGVVAWRPRARARDVDGDRLVENLVVVMISKLKGRAINKRFECRAGLALGLRNAVEGARNLGAAPADHGAYGAVGRHDNDRGLRFGFFVHTFFEHFFQGVLCRSLDVLIQCGVDDNVFGRLTSQIVGAIRHDPIGKIAPGLCLCRFGQFRRNLLGDCGVCRRKVALRLHQIDNNAGPILRTGQVVGWRVARRGHKQSCQHRGF